VGLQAMIRQAHAADIGIAAALLRRRFVVARLGGGALVPPCRHVAFRAAGQRKGDEPEH
jgi:hypothetical protein